MALRIYVTGGQQVLETFRAKAPQVIETMRQKMTLLMIQLAGHTVEETIPQFFPKGAPNIAASVRALPATASGTVIHGEVQYGGPRTTKETLGGPNAGAAVDYAQVQEEGVAHGWEIQPVLFASAQSILTRNVKSRAVHGAGAAGGGLPLALAFVSGGRQVIVRRVYHPPLRPHPFAFTALQDMRDKIIYDLQTALTETLAT